MAKSKIPKSARKGLKKALLENSGKAANLSKDKKNETRRNIRQGIRDGDIKRIKTTWAVDVGDLVRVKSNNTRLRKDIQQATPIYGIVTYKHNKITYQNQEDEYIIVMTPYTSALRMHPKQVEVIQD